MDKVLVVENLHTHFFTENGVVEAVEDVSFHLEKGEMLGLIGESGCGKTTVIQSILRLLEYPGKVMKGKAVMNGIDLLHAPMDQIEKLRWKTISVIPQSAMNALNPVMTVGDQIVEAILLHEEVTKDEAIKRTEYLLEIVDIPKQRRKSYPHEFSGGMKQRVAIAMALSCQPQIVISDESTTGLDVLTQAQVIAVIKDLQKKMDLSIILISHDLPMVTAICERVAIMYAGKLVEWATTEQLLNNPQHPYSQGLLAATPDINNLDKVCKSIPGTVPMLIDPPKGCRFQTRCPSVMDKCKQQVPVMRKVQEGHYVSCFLGG
ncbi:ABC transporter ATP-binding protein [Brevibacillus centrosporus]|uniref:ABC transporter ATP-binding protein n=1 Tax=Brevibacillus centrosporus TaxID=54910 RepID=UPI0011439B2C|nr:ABC transporter ATP-binding protein [Brevibacillus centrosporus]MEC2127823.1 ABC transporter ATP-binding protein [Brevibacillus centrosporus]GED32063.1 dipeptide/oligopeptide/nickel ABC transporter ATP-binding protein [Brevibacillus centrosporus]